MISMCELVLFTPAKEKASVLQRDLSSQLCHRPPNLLFFLCKMKQ